MDDINADLFGENVTIDGIPHTVTKSWALNPHYVVLTEPNGVTTVIRPAAVVRRGLQLDRLLG